VKQRLRIGAVVAATAMLATACSAAQVMDGDVRQPVKEPAKPASSYRVLESFGVGRDVYVRALEVDRARNSIWVGTSVGAHEVDLTTRNPIHTFTRKEGLANEYVFSIFVDSQDNKWFGTNGGGASRYKAGNWKTYFPMHGLADYWVYSFAEQRPGVIWIGTWNGANRLDMATGKFKTYVHQLVNEWVYGVTVDAKQRVWFGTEGGVSMFDGKHWKSWTHKDGMGAPNEDNLPISLNTGLGTRSRHNLSVLVDGEPTYNPNYVFCIQAAPDGSIWAGTWGGGVSRFDGKNWTNYTSHDGLAGDIVFSMTRDKQGTWWFGTNKGLSRFDGKHWQTFSREDGLFGNSVYAVAAAPNGDIWVGTKQGVVRIGR
jgi:ligand-binding sensor domain-containing protein